MKRLIASLALALAATFTAQAQVTYTAGPTIPGLADTTYLPTAAYPAGAPAPFGLLPLPNSGGLIPGPLAIAGGMASDDRNGVLYTSDGFQMTMDQNLTYQGFGPLTPVPILPMPILLPPGAFVLTGLCFDDAGGQLWGCDNNQFWPMNPLPPFGPLAAPLPIPGLVGPASGLGFDSATNSLFACDIAGAIYHFTPAGVPIGFQPVNVVGTAAPAQGLAVNTSNGAGSAGPPGCSTQTIGYHVTIADGINVYDALGFNPPIPTTTSGGNQIWGHTYSSDFQVKNCAVAGTTPGCSFAPPRAGMRRVNYTGPGAPQALRCVGAPPLTSGFLLADLCPQPTCWFGLWLSPFTWSLGGIITDAAGEHSFPVGFTFLPAGIQFSFQYAIFDPFAPLGYCMSNLCTVTTGLP